MRKAWRPATVLAATAVIGATWIGAGSASASRAHVIGFSSWSQVLAAARGQTVNFYMWSGSTQDNNFVTNMVGAAAKRFGVTLRRVPISSTTDAIQTVLGEKEAGKNNGGAVDLVWVNGDNFASGKQARLWSCGYQHLLPNASLVNWKDPSIAYDFGVATAGCEIPWGRAQFTMAYNTAMVPKPPSSMPALIAWIKAHPGEFTYPAPPDFTGSVFVREMLYYVAGGYKGLLGKFSQAKYNQVAPKLWKELNALKPYLWRQGATYPTTIDQLATMYGSGEVAFYMTYAPGDVGGKVSAGSFPNTTREFVFNNGMIGNTNYVAMPYNSPHKAAAMVVENILLSPQFQYEEYLPTTMGQYPAIAMSRAGSKWVQKVASVKLPPSVAPANVLTKNSNPELMSQWDTALDSGWKTNVLEK